MARPADALHGGVGRDTDLDRVARSPLGKQIERLPHGGAKERGIWMHRPCPLFARTYSLQY